MEKPIEIKGSVYEVLFDRVLAIHTLAGYQFQGWQGWPRLNEFYPCDMKGDYLVCDENNCLMEFVCDKGSHPCTGGGIAGDHEKAFALMRKEFGLTLEKDVDAASSMTYPGHRRRYYKVNKMPAGDGFRWVL